MTDKVNLVGDISAAGGSFVNIGTIYNSTIKTIQNIPYQDFEGKETKDIKQHLKELAKAISDEDSLSADTKKDALQNVDKLSEALRATAPEQRKLKAGMAFSSLKVLSSGVASAAKLAGSMEKLLPHIGGFFGLV